MITCSVECQECGLDFFRLALAVDLEKKDPLVFPASSSSSLLPVTNPRRFTIVVDVSARGLPSRPLPSTRERFRENISISLLFSIRHGATSQPFLFGCFCTKQLKGLLHICSHLRMRTRRRWKRQSHTELSASALASCQHRGRSVSQNPPSSN